MKKLKLLILVLSLICNFSIAQPALSLLVNYSESDTLRAGDPLILTLQISNPGAEFAIQNNEFVRKNLEALQEEYEAGKYSKLEFDKERQVLENSFLLLDSFQVTGDWLHSNLSVLHNDQALSKDAYLNCHSDIGSNSSPTISAGQRLELLLGIPPAITQSWIPMEHTFSIKIDTLKSNKASVLVQPKDTTAFFDLTRSLELGYYYLDCGSLEEAVNIADTIIEHIPGSIDGNILKADALLAQEERDMALPLYIKALELFYEQFPNSYEAPGYLLDKINELDIQE